MKRKLFYALTVLILTCLLSSCSASEPVSTDTGEPAPTEREQTISSGVLLPSGALPDTAFSVPEPPERYYPDTMLEFVPSQDYGRILPYIGGWTYSVMGVSTELYGVCDESGKIICDAVYNDVKLIEHGGHKLYAFVKNKLGHDGNYYGYEYPTTLVSTDGSYAAVYDSVIWAESFADEITPPLGDSGYSTSFRWREAVSYDYITARRGGKWGVIDWDGSVLLPFEYHAPVCFYEGFASVLSEDESSVYFVDITGKTVLGPYQAPPLSVYEMHDPSGAISYANYKLMFYDGFTRFYENGKFGMIDRTGNVVIPAEYDFITSFYNGTAQIVLDMDKGWGNWKNGLVNSAGEVVSEPERDVWLSSDETVEINYPAYVDNKYIFEKTGNEFPVDKYNLDYINNELIIIADREKGVWRLYDYDGNPLTPERPGSISYYRPPGGERYLWIAAAKYGMWTWPPSYELYDLSGNMVLEGTFKTIIPFEDKFLVRNERTAGLMDSGGNYIIEVSVLGHGID